MTNPEARKRAEKKVEDKIGFYIHLAIYLLVNALLVFLYLRSSKNNLWFIWPLFGWGIGVLFHGLGVFAFADGSKIKERMIEKELEKEKKG